MRLSRAHFRGRPLQAGGELNGFDGGGDRSGARGNAGIRMRVEGFELARPALHPEQNDRLSVLAGRAGGIGGPGEELAHGRQPGRAGEAGAAQEPASGQWFHENSVELRSAQKRSSRRWVRLMVGSASDASKCARFGGGRPAGERGQVRHLHRARVVGCHPGDARRRVEGALLDLFADQTAIHEQKPLGNGARAAVELVLAAIAVALDEVVLLTVADEAGEDV